MKTGTYVMDLADGEIYRFDDLGLFLPEKGGQYTRAELLGKHTFGGNTFVYFIERFIEIDERIVIQFRRKDDFYQESIDNLINYLENTKRGLG